MPTYRRSLARSGVARVAWTVASAAARASTATLALVWEAACSTGQTGGIETTVAPAASGVMSGSGAMNLGVSNTVTAISTALPLSSGLRVQVAEGRLRETGDSDRRSFRP